MAHQADREVILIMLSKTCWTMPCWSFPFLKACKWTLCMENWQTGWNTHWKQVNWSELASPFHKLHPKRIKQFNLSTTSENCWTNRSRKKCHNFQCPKNLGHGPESQGLFEFATSFNMNVGHCHMELHPKLKEVAHFDISWMWNGSFWQWVHATAQAHFKKMCPTNLQNLRMKMNASTSYQWRMKKVIWAITIDETNQNGQNQKCIQKTHIFVSKSLKA